MMRQVIARVRKTADGWHVAETRGILKAMLGRRPEVEIAIPRGANPDIDAAGEGFYVAEVWPGDDAAGTATLFNVKTESPVSRGLRW
jgi:hypothetical protein